MPHPPRPLPRASTWLLAIQFGLAPDQGGVPSTAPPLDPAPAQPQAPSEGEPPSGADMPPFDSRAELEGSKPVGAQAQLPRRLPPLATAGWWMAFGSFVLLTSAGVMAGLAEREEDKLLRLATTFQETGAQPLYEDRRVDYETGVARGHSFERSSWGLLAGASILLVGSAVLFLLQARRNRRARSQR